MFLVFYFQVDGNGNCRFSSINRALGVHAADNHDHSNYPTRYLSPAGGCVAGVKLTEGVLQPHRMAVDKQEL